MIAFALAVDVVLSNGLPGSEPKSAAQRNYR